MTEINERSKKSDILEAYEEVLKKLKSQKMAKPREEAQRVEEKQVIQKSAAFTSEKIIQELTDTKLKLGKSLDDLEMQLLERYKEFANLQKAIEVSKKDLNYVHKITEEADSLAALMQTHQEIKQCFEEEMKEHKTLWEKRKKEVEQAQKEEEELVKVSRKRNEEEYQYQLKMKRQKDLDQYETQKISLTKELAQMREKAESDLLEREKKVSEQEQEFKALRSEAETFPTHLKEMVEEKEKETEEKVRKELQFQIELSQKEREGEKKLYEQRIIALEETIEELEKRVSLLNKKLDEASSQVKGIAFKAIEGASVRAPYGSYVDFSHAKSKTPVSD